MINLLYAGNAGIFDGILISVLSATKHTREPLKISLLTMDKKDTDKRFAPLDESMRSFLEKLCKEANGESSVGLFDVGDLYDKYLEGSPNAQTGYTPYCFLRLFASRLPLPDKVLYLDADTVVNADLSELFSTNVSGFEYAAALDYYGKIFMGYHYINSGVMLLNLAEIRKTGLFEKAVRLCSEKKIFLPDQTALHRLTTRKLILPRKYNEQKRYDRRDTVIQHFTKTILWFPFFHTRTVKPWQTELVREVLTTRYDGLLEEYIQKKKEYEETKK